MTQTQPTNESKIMTSHKILGINDDQNTCTKCGKTGLKRVVWMIELDSDGGEVGKAFHVGTSCAAYLMHGNKSASSKATVSDFAKWVSIAQTWLNSGHSFENVLKAVRAKSGYAISANGTKIEFWSRTERKVVASAEVAA